RDKVFQTPPREWVEERLTQLQDVLERNPDRSGLILRSFLGPLRLDPTRGDIGRPYYTARTALNTLALLDPLTEDEVREASSNSFQWWRRRDSNPRPPACKNDMRLFQGGSGRSCQVTPSRFNSGSARSSSRSDSKSFKTIHDGASRPGICKRLANR